MPNARAIDKAIEIAVASASATTSARFRARNSLSYKRAQIFTYEAELDQGIQELKDMDKLTSVFIPFQKIPGILLRAIQLDPKQVDFSVEEAESLERYIYATDLIIRCKESAVRRADSKS